MTLWTGNPHTTPYTRDYRILKGNHLLDVTVVLDCRACLRFADFLETCAMPGELWVQRHKLVIAWSRARHTSDVRTGLGLRLTWLFQFLRVHEWPAEDLMSLAPIFADYGPDDALPLQRKEEDNGGGRETPLRPALV